MLNIAFYTESQSDEGIPGLQGLSCKRRTSVVFSLLSSIVGVQRVTGGLYVHVCIL